MHVAIGLGSNLGDRITHLRMAVRQLEERFGPLVAVSSLYRSDPVGGPEQPDYLNAVVVIDTDRTLEQVLAACLDIEQLAGRTRTEPWGPRTLDLDVLAAAAPPVATEHLTVPHPRAAERRFVLEPLEEVWPEAAVGPGSARAFLEQVQDQKVDRLAETDWVKGLSKGGWWVVAQVVLLIWVIGGAVQLPPGSSLFGRWLGAVVVLSGLLFALWAGRSLGKSLTPYPEPTTGAALISQGPYRLVRHPIYGGIIIALVGLALFQGSTMTLVGAVEMGALFWLKSSFEERRLLIAHPMYRQYQQAVPRRLIPFLV